MQGNTDHDQNRIYVSTDCNPTSTLSYQPNQTHYCFLTNVMPINLFEIYTSVNCNIYVGINIYQYSTGSVLKTRYYSNNYLSNNTQIFVDSLNTTLKTSLNFERYFLFKAEIGNNPGAVYITLEGQSILDTGRIFVTGDCLGGLNYFTTINNYQFLTSISQNSLLTLTLFGNCTISKLQLSGNGLSYDGDSNFK